MPRRSGTDTNEALELFLDTITNTFGGVLFIALVVSILVQTSGTGAGSLRAADLDEVIRRKNELAELEAEVARLKDKAASQEDQIRDLQPRGNADDVRQYKKLEEEERTLKDEYATLSSKARALERQNKDAERKNQEQEKERTRLEKQLEKVEAQLKEARKPTTHRIRLPKLRKTEKDEVAVLLTGRRMCFGFKYDDRGNRLGPFSDDVSVSQDGLSMKPKSGRGTKITDGKAFGRELKRQLRRFNKDKHYIAVAVWPDSYGEFEILRDALVDMGFDYGLIIMSEGEPVRLGISGSGVQ